jgi:hypothetical protein
VKENEMSKCELCGEPMPEGEEMFKFHGYSGDCPKPRLPQDNGIEAVKRLFKKSTGVDVDVRVDNGEFIVIDPKGQEFRSGLVRKQ